MRMIVSNCPKCGSTQIAVVQYSRGMDIQDIKKAAKQGCLVYFVKPTQKIQYNRVCLSCRFFWNDPDVRMAGAEYAEYQKAHPPIPLETLRAYKKRKRSASQLSLLGRWKRR